MTIFGPCNLDAMNETDVREIIVRPLLHALGYRQGSQANILTEKRLRYGKAFLGRKDPRDPDLIGRADYICEVVSYGRWVVEVKSPQHELTLDDAHQAHTYAAHPEVAAVFSLLTNGKEFRLYRISEPDKPIFMWKFEETEPLLMNISNILGPEAIKRRVVVSIDLKKPLASGYNSVISITGGYLVYERHTSSTPIFASAANAIDGMRASVIGKAAHRTDDGRIQAEIEVAGPYTAFDALSRAAGLNTYVFSTSDEFISTDREQPTIAQNLVTMSFPPGMTIPRLPGLPALPGNRLPFGINTAARTEAVGYIDQDRFKGTFDINYVFEFTDLPPAAQGMIQSRAEMSGEGTFELVIQR